MDPLSITASTITLIQAAGGIAYALTGFVNSCRNADSRIASLCEEVTSLASVLRAVQQTIEGRTPFDLADVEEDLWEQSELALINCRNTLSELDGLVRDISEKSEARRLGWRVRAAVDLRIYGDEIVAFRDKVHQSNWALQMMLNTISVSLSLRHNASQEMIILSLGKLKNSIEEALHASSRPVGGFSHGFGPRPDSILSHNLRHMANAATRFHSTVSSTAGSIRDDTSSLRPPSTYRDRVQDRVEQYLHVLRPGRPPSTAPTHSGDTFGSVSPPASTLMVTARSGSKMAVSTVQEEDESKTEILREFFVHLQDLVVDHIKSGNIQKAITLLDHAAKKKVAAGVTDESLYRFQIQLAFCYFLQGAWQEAEPIVETFMLSKASHELLVCNLGHALSLLYYRESLLDKALEMCEKVLNLKWRLCKADQADWNDYFETLRLQASVLYSKEETIQAEVYMHQLPQHFQAYQPGNEVEYLRSQTRALLNMLGVFDEVEEGNPDHTNIPVELYGETDPSSERMASINTQLSPRISSEAQFFHSLKTSQSYVPLGRRIGRFFKSARIKHAQVDEATPSDGNAESTPPQSTLLGVRRSRSVLRKRVRPARNQLGTIPEEGEKPAAYKVLWAREGGVQPEPDKRPAFRLMSMRRMTSLKSSELSQRPGQVRLIYDLSQCLATNEHQSLSQECPVGVMAELDATPALPPREEPDEIPALWPSCPYHPETLQEYTPYRRRASLDEWPQESPLDLTLSLIDDAPLVGTTENSSTNISDSALVDDVGEPEIGDEISSVTQQSLNPHRQCPTSPLPTIIEEPRDVPQEAISESQVDVPDEAPLCLMEDPAKVEIKDHEEMASSGCKKHENVDKIAVKLPGEITALPETDDGVSPTQVKTIEDVASVNLNGAEEHPPIIARKMTCTLKKLSTRRRPKTAEKLNDTLIDLTATLAKLRMNDDEEWRQARKADLETHLTALMSMTYEGALMQAILTIITALEDGDFLHEDGDGVYEEMANNTDTCSEASSSGSSLFDNPSTSAGSSTTTLSKMEGSPKREFSFTRGHKPAGELPRLPSGREKADSGPYGAYMEAAEKLAGPTRNMLSRCSSSIATFVNNLSEREMPGLDS